MAERNSSKQLTLHDRLPPGLRRHASRQTSLSLAVLVMLC
jgi:hypothetical protein